MATFRHKNHKLGGSLQAMRGALDLLEEKVNKLPEDVRGDFQKIVHVMVKGLIRVETQAEDLKAISYRFINPDIDVDYIITQMKVENANKKILVVEDDEIMIEITPQFLKQCGFPVLLAFNEKSAKELILQEKPSLILIDLVLGGSLGGIEILRFIKDNHIPTKCIVQTRMDDDHIIKQVEELGADKILLKPFSLRELEAQINGLLGKIEN